MFKTSVPNHPVCKFMGLDFRTRVGLNDSQKPTHVVDTINTFGSRAHDEFPYEKVQVELCRTPPAGPEARLLCSVLKERALLGAGKVSELLPGKVSELLPASGGS